MTQDLVLQAFRSGRGSVSAPEGVFHHSDRGSQYATQTYLHWLAAEHMLGRHYPITPAIDIILQQRQSSIAKAAILVEAVEATSSQSTLLNIRSGFPILRRTITMYLQHDELVITGPIAIIIA
ncbi:MAG: hypothetical protein M1499_02995 [Firmicutes bacterium]|nr:hypothetical protein [Bacillota bacterium]